MKLEKMVCFVGIFITAGVSAVLSSMLAERDIAAKIDMALADRENEKCED